MPQQSPANTTAVDIFAAAEQLQVTERTIRRWISEGRLPAYRYGPKLVRIHQADLDAMGVLIPSAATI